MWLVGSKVVDVYLSTRSVRVAQGRDLLIDSPADGFDAASTQLNNWLADEVGTHKLRIWLSGGLCRPFLMAIPEGISQTEELKAIACANAGEATGLMGPCNVWIDRRKGEPRLMAVTLLTQVLSRLDELKAASIRPWWAAALNEAVNAASLPSSLSIQDDDSVTFLAGSGGSFQLATTLSPIADASTAQAALSRLMFTHGLSGPVGMRIQLEFTKRADDNTSSLQRLPFATWARLSA